jgi:ornithine cyclodeaminase/alanine dehydrogenase-like protein (mu-crystallin family)
MATKDTEGVLALSNDDVQAVFDMPACVDLLESGFRRLGEGDAVNPPRVDRSVKRDPNDFEEATDPTYFRLKTMTGASTEAGIIRINSDMCHWPLEHGSRQKEKIRATDDDKYVGFVLVFDPDTTAPYALMPDGYLQRMRVGGTSGVGTKYMAREDATSAALFGSGWQAGAQVLALCEVRDLDDIAVFSPTREHREEFAAEFDERVAPTVHAVESPEEAVSGADIVHTATSSMSPVFDPDLLEPGTHVTCLGVHEVGAGTVERADSVAQTWSEQVRLTDDGARMQEESIRTKTVENFVVGDPDEVPRFDKDEDALPDIDWPELPGLADLIVDPDAGRDGEDDITLFLERGLGAQFLATAPWIHDRAVEEGLGTRLPPGLFTQELTP